MGGATRRACRPRRSWARAQSNRIDLRPDLEGFIQFQLERCCRSQLDKISGRALNLIVVQNRSTYKLYSTLLWYGYGMCQTHSSCILAQNKTIRWCHAPGFYSTHHSGRRESQEHLISHFALCFFCVHLIPSFFVVVASFFFLFPTLCAICFLSLTFDRALFHSPSAAMEADSPSKVRSRADKDR